MTRSFRSLPSCSALALPAFALFAVTALAPAPLAAQGSAVPAQEWQVPWGAADRPRDPFVAPDGHVFFVGQQGNYIARLDPTGKRPDGTGSLRTLTVDDYARNIGPQLERGGFFERELGRKLERYGNIVHLMSAYDSRRTAADPAPFARGVNSFQLWFDGTRWYVVTIYWEQETPENPIPPEWIIRP